MRTLLSIVALLVAAIGALQAGGAIHWNPSLVDLVMGAGMLLGTFGVVPFKLTVLEHRVFASVATIVSAAVAAHASGALPGKPVVFNIIAIGGALAGLLGRWDAPVPPTPATPVPPAPTPPAAS